MDKLKVIYKKLEDITPYENNPRKNDEAVQFVKNSIEQFGFKNPIIIDSAGVIVAGHTRFKAAQELGLKEVPTISAEDLTPEQVKAFRIADNKTGEKALWDDDILKDEMQELMDNFDFTNFGFGEFELTMLMQEFDENRINSLFEDAPEKEKEPKQVQCPHCGGWFEV